MTYTTRTIKAAATLIIGAAALCISTPAFADGHQADVQTCRVAMTAQSNFDMNDYRLRFEQSKGKRVRTVYLKAIPHKGGTSFQFTCRLNRTQVLALNSTSPYTKLAWSK